jgi:hypothetical protein
MYQVHIWEKKHQYGVMTFFNKNKINFLYICLNEIIFSYERKK